MRIIICLLGLLGSSLALADSCQLITSPAVTNRAIQILKDNYPHEQTIELFLGPIPSYYFKPYSFTISNPHATTTAHAEFFPLEANLSLGSGRSMRIYIDLGFTFYKESASGKYKNLAVAAGCKTFGKVYTTLDEISEETK